MKNTLLALLLGLCASCVMPSDIHSLRANMDDFQTGVVTKPEFDQRNAEIVSTIDARTAELKKEAGDIPTDPMSLIAYLATIAGTIGTAVVGTNKIRDNQRKQLGEPVAKKHLATVVVPKEPTA